MEDLKTNLLMGIIICPTCGRSIKSLGYARHRAAHYEQKQKMKKRVIFVGIHNKPGKTPLDSTTRSGKVIDEIIAGLPEFDCFKTNLHNLEYLPEDSIVDWQDTFTAWKKRAGIKPGQIIGRDVIVVCLGAYTQQVFRRTRFTSSYAYYNILKIGHPAAPRSTESINKYITQAIAKISHPVNL